MATLTFYNDVPLNVKNNYIIDDLESFLDSYMGTFISEFSFIDTSKIDNTIISQFMPKSQPLMSWAVDFAYER